jgi:uncharacterized repeat protein (TIGR01451 family)
MVKRQTRGNFYFRSFFWAVILFTNFAALSGEMRAWSPHPQTSAPILWVDPQAIDFGSVTVGETVVQTVTISNRGGDTLTFSATISSDAVDSGIIILSQPQTLTLQPAMSTTFRLAFRPVNADSFTGSITVNSNGGNSTIALRGRSIQPNTLKVRVISPKGGEAFQAGEPITVTYDIDLDDQPASVGVAFSSDGGKSFLGGDIPVSPLASTVSLNLPENIVTDRGLVRVIATDRSGRTGTATSGLFAVVGPNSRKIVLSFDPPTVCGEPPRNLRVLQATNMCGEPGSVEEPSSCTLPAAVLPGCLVGYNIFRVPVRPDGIIPSPDEITQPQNLIGSIQTNRTCFTDNIPLEKGSNFVYAITGFFGDGRSSLASSAAATDFPVLINPIFKGGALFFDASGGLIKPGAQLVVDDKETFDLQPDDRGALFTVPKNARSKPSGLTLKQLIKKGKTVQLRIKNPDGSSSCNVPFTRPRK